MTEGATAGTALVVFVDQTECPWLRVLHRGFRHCFAAVSDGHAWIVCDPLKDRMELAILRLPARFDLAGFYAGQGYEVLIGRVRHAPPQARLTLAPLTCVAIVKRILGLRAFWVLTPRQLFDQLCDARAGAFVRYVAGTSAGPAPTKFELDTAAR